jgi:hypothetical protein
VYIYVCDDDALATRAGTLLSTFKTQPKNNTFDHGSVCVWGGSEPIYNHSLQIEGKNHAAPMENYFINMEIPLVSFFGGVSLI